MLKISQECGQNIFIIQQWNKLVLFLIDNTNKKKETRDENV